jgi:hypothetical protein
MAPNPGGCPFRDRFGNNRNEFAALAQKIDWTLGTGPQIHQGKTMCYNLMEQSLQRIKRLKLYLKIKTK